MPKVRTEIFCGSKMRQARVILDIKLDELAETTQMDKALLWQFEKGVKQPTKEQEKIIADALLVTPVFFHWMETSPLTEDDCTFDVIIRRL